MLSAEIILRTMEILDFHNLIYPWNHLNYKGEDSRRLLNRKNDVVELDDETLRDGLQSPSVKTPAIGEKLKILHFMEDLSVNIADIGLPAAGPKMFSDVLRLAKEIADNGMNIQAACAGRTAVSDIDPIIEISQKAGIAVEAHIFLGTSMIRRFSEEWDLTYLLKATEESVSYCVKNNLPVMYVTEDTTRVGPRELKKCYAAAIGAGARRICVSDTVGYATPDGIMNLMDFIKDIVWECGEEVKIDWHGHNDKGLSLCNALVAAIDAGVDRIHGTCLGIGERAGNTPIDQLLINLSLKDMYRGSLTSLGAYCRYVSEVCQIAIPPHYPVVGKDAFRTATGVHAAAIVKAMKKSEDAWLSDYVYSGVPAHAVGLSQVVEIGPMSGKANVEHWLAKQGIAATDSLVAKILSFAKEQDHILSDPEIRRLLY
jgi:2-isopropylmalate synthase